MNAITQAGEEFGIPPEMMERYKYRYGRFNDAMANGDTPEGAFSTALDAGGDAYVHGSVWIQYGLCGHAGRHGSYRGWTGEMGGMTADMMDAIPPGAMAV